MSTTALLAELRHADHIIKTMLNAMAGHQQASLGAKLEADGVAGESMTRHHERATVIAAAAALASASTQLPDIEQQAADILSQADHADILLQALFDKLTPVAHTPEVAAVNCFATCTARAVMLMRQAADNIVAMVAEGGAA